MERIARKLMTRTQNILILHHQDSDKSQYQSLLTGTQNKRTFLSFDEIDNSTSFESYSLILVDLNTRVNVKLSELKASLFDKVASSYQMKSLMSMKPLAQSMIA